MAMQRFTSKSTQRGAVIVIVTVAVAALIMMAGLALDMGHAFLNKTRLQNTADAAALAAAKVLDQTGNTALATAEAMQAFGANAVAAGNQELGDAYASGNGMIQVTVEYSATLPPFTPGSLTGPYVRVNATGFVMPAWLVRVGGIMQKTVAATAVAGPRTLTSGSTVCNVAPMMVCGDSAAPGMWGYTLNEPAVLKKSTPGGQSAVGPGNFQLIQLGGSGADVVRNNMAGSYSACIAGGSTIQTQTGNEAGPVAQRRPIRPTSSSTASRRRSAPNCTMRTIPCRATTSTRARRALLTKTLTSSTATRTTPLISPILGATTTSRQRTEASARSSVASWRFPSATVMER
jgi:Flp pilus assembly protein TadG